MSTVESFLDDFKPEVRETALKVRTLVRSVFPEASEELRPTYRTIAYGSSSKMADEVCYIAPLSSSVNLGFHFGTQLPDPNGLLRGTGKLMRHLKLESPEEVNNPAVKVLLEAAKTHASF
ncbi:DUF1801 domain-containing protein [Tellurirhabdus bombi]|uniref:DUF1801 domain-containing protein n=1 Tax=Tellurirhabdus bombi TaxID=2907205 RepID=UPI001F1AFA45|nr:DUF1801 domain-containing protein [Tellurirhabdus bombi]